ncbi:hypothetical protein BDN67DRAFT_254766 [Paxillus ammoniavirescens]|nr:hypothetical protein BDN67DRAFT_254766 [Paxillus ammoniavirescens]
MVGPIVNNPVLGSNMGTQVLSSFDTSGEALMKSTIVNPWRMHLFGNYPHNGPLFEPGSDQSCIIFP